MSTLTISDLHVSIETESGPVEILKGVDLVLEQDVLGDPRVR